MKKTAKKATKREPKIKDAKPGTGWITFKVQGNEVQTRASLNLKVPQLLHLAAAMHKQAKDIALTPLKQAMGMKD